jgi:2-amino-4-hydroxy-6-hydroxymethyldihydropteridine diphosphokinase
MNRATSKAYLGIGSNLDVERNVRSGADALRETFGEVHFSPVYRSAAVGFTGGDFINLAACITTRLQPLELKDYLNALENRHGRLRNTPKFSDRTLDVDILLYDDLYLHCPALVLPRPEVLHYAHVLKPLADLAPELIHPVARRCMDELWRNFTGDRSGLVRVDFPL